MADKPTIRIRNWEKFQHYTDRLPPWIKLHRSLLEDRKWHDADDTAARLLVECWLLASESQQGGEIHASFADIAWRLRRDEAIVATALLSLERLGFIEVVNRDAFKPLATRLQDAPQRRGETERETKTEAEGRKRKRPIPDDWKPNDQHRTLATDLGVVLLREAENYRDHAIANRRLLVDWDAGFRQWLRKAPAFQRPSSGAPAKAVGNERPREDRSLERVDPFTEKARAEASRRRESIRAYAADHPELADVARNEATEEIALEMPTARRDAQLAAVSKRYEEKLWAMIERERAA